MLSLLFNSCIVHGFLPDYLISSFLIPIVKDKSGDVMDKGNYRPIALSSVISKVLEGLLAPFTPRPHRILLAYI